MLTNKDFSETKLIIKTEKNARVIYRANALRLRHLGWTRVEVAEILDITTRTVVNIENAYFDDGFKAAIYDDERSGPPVVFDDRIKADIIAMVCSDPPEGWDRWTLKLIKKEACKRGLVKDISTSKIQVILEESDLKPWQQKQWCVTELNDEYIKRMEDVLDVYERPYDPNCPVVCLDEKPIQLLEDIRPSSGVVPGEVKKVDYEYRRKGTANVFCAVEPKTGKYINKVTNRRTGADFALFLRELEKKYQSAEKIVLIMDNLNIHGKKSLTDTMGEEKANILWNRFEVHHTPKHASWLNQAEIAIGMYSRQCLGRARIPDIQTLEKKTKAWNRIANKNKVKINWQFNTAKAREKFDYKI
jgi:transposase/DNA-binding XRE family transcriptional regulator